MTDQQERSRVEAEFARSDASTDPFVSAVRATRMPMLITDPSQPDNPIVFVNAAFSSLTGYDRDEIIGRNCRFLQGPETSKADIAKIRAAVEGRVPVEIELLNHKKDGEVFWNRLLISPVFDRDGALTYFFASQSDVTLERDKLTRMQRDRAVLEQEVERRTSELTRSEERLRFILKAGRFGSWTLDLAEMRLAASETCKENFGRSAGDPFSYEDLIAAIDPEDRPRMQAAVQTSIREHSDYDIEYRARTPAGEMRWLQIRGQTFYDAVGQPLSMAGVSIDVTERKRAEEHRTLLADELNHRVKNSMATMQSIAHQTLRNAASLEEAHRTLDARLQSLSAAHDVLTRESWIGATLSVIVEGTLTAFRGGAGQRFVINGPEVWLTPRLTLAFTMALHELATNAVKYGALSNDKGRVILNWDVMDGAKPAHLWFRWEEVGGPAVTAPTRGGFGTRLIERALSAELGGSAEIEYRSRGVVFTLDAPLPDRAASPIKA
ncbi:PAS domain S-box-containing protein [Methylobacterium sp. UNC378MF]|uniref:HWE histidine kinase domain-containing protein n=1 Tax=Methylobacterium sp. UNC378MF TaxID=1502748 RepID=UPI00088DBA3A|nr:HWE histidine kinase domain-containing protein [Methylobacterium sp. UNC378MF]SDA22397.1 PAS domain S-box-containing protein [Methylobacterium sp. UNC378MF]